MSTQIQFLLIVCLVLRSSSSAHSNDQHDVAEAVSGYNRYQRIETKDSPIDQSQSAPIEKDTESRSIDAEHYDDNFANRDQHEAFQNKAKPLRNIFMGIYKNYKSTYLGNRTSSQYRKTLIGRTNTHGRDPAPQLDAEPVIDEDGEEYGLRDPGPIMTTLYEEKDEEAETPAPKVSTQKPAKKKRKRRRKNRNKKKKRVTFIPKPPTGGDDPLISSHDGEYQYNVGPGLNMSLDMNNDIVSVNLDENSLKDIFMSRWNDNSEEGRGKKYEVMTKVLPLFIIPFLIQSAIIPFLVTKLKLLLVKSILVGKLAIFLLIVSAFKNSNKAMQTYEVPPSYWAGEPSRRSEIAAAAFNGYRVEGRPASWINR